MALVPLFLEVKNLLILNVFGIIYNRQFPNTIIRSKGLFWLASRPGQALVWGQAGGSLKADSAGVWWSSMSFDKRIRDLVFIENQDEIEKDWHKEFGDRKNEIVFYWTEI